MATQREPAEKPVKTIKHQIGRLAQVMAILELIFGGLALCVGSLSRAAGTRSELNWKTPWRYLENCSHK